MPAINSISVYGNALQGTVPAWKEGNRYGQLAHPCCKLCHDRRCLSSCLLDAAQHSRVGFSVAVASEVSLEGLHLAVCMAY